MSQIVENYGLHWDGPIAWLVQGRGASNFVGLKAQAPFRTKGGQCNHLIPAAAPIPDRVHWDQWMKMAHDPLVRMMLPLPHRPEERVAFFADGSMGLALFISNLSRLSSPINSIIKPAWTLKTKDLERELSASNVQPLVISQIAPQQQPLVDAIGQLAPHRPRTVILLGTPDIVVSPPIVRRSTDILKFPLEDMVTLPLENIGATIIRRYSRREDIDGPMETRDERRDRMLRERSKQ